MRNVMTSWDIDNDDGNDNDSDYSDDEDIMLKMMISRFFFFFFITIIQLFYKFSALHSQANYFCDSDIGIWNQNDSGNDYDMMTVKIND